MGNVTYLNFKKKIIGTEPLDSRIKDLLDLAAAKIMPTLKNDDRGIVLDVYVAKHVYDKEEGCMVRTAEWNVLYGRDLSLFEEQEKPLGDWGRFGYMTVSPLTAFNEDELSISTEDWYISLNGYTTTLLEWRENPIGDKQLEYKHNKSPRDRGERDDPEQQCENITMLYGKILSSCAVASDKFAISEYQDYFFYNKEIDSLRCAEQANDVLRKMFNGFRLDEHRYTH